MPTLYVENVPKDLYEALRERVRLNHASIAAEVLNLLSDNVPTQAELTRRRSLFTFARKLRMTQPAGQGPFPTTEEMQRKDRDR